jgi:hypothetical protein
MENVLSKADQKGCLGRVAKVIAPSAKSTGAAAEAELGGRPNTRLFYANSGRFERSRVD